MGVGVHSYKCVESVGNFERGKVEEGMKVFVETLRIVVSTGPSSESCRVCVTVVGFFSFTFVRMCCDLACVLLSKSSVASLARAGKTLDR